MVAELGIFFLILTLVFSSFGFLQPILSNISKNILLFSQEKLSVLIFTFTLLSFFCLAYSFIVSDFSLNVVVNNSNTQLPIIYKITGVWGNHEGSILLWLLVMTFFGFLFSIQNILILNGKDVQNDDRIIPIIRFQSIYELCPENINVLEEIFGSNE